MVTLLVLKVFEIILELTIMFGITYILINNQKDLVLFDLCMHQVQTCLLGVVERHSGKD